MNFLKHENLQYELEEKKANTTMTILVQALLSIQHILININEECSTKFLFILTY